MNMANLQKYFEKFHENIRTDYDMNQTLREKKDIILDRIRRHLNEKGRPGFDEILQGSYKMGTGICPIAELEFDIDVGLRFRINAADYKAQLVRSWVFEAVDGHTEKVEEKGPCIRVTYSDGYHVDLVVYAAWTDELGQDQIRLAHKKEGWLAADPQGLLEHVRSARKRFEGTEDAKTNTDQFRRSVRYLKRWNDIAIPVERPDKPTGLAFTLLCCNILAPRVDVFLDSDDRTALYILATSASLTAGRIIAKKPTPQYEDMFGRLSDSEMMALKERFRVLAATLDEAARETDPREACKKLRKVFGDDFPVPDPEATGKKSAAPAIVTSSASA
jgi:hypothetical protein